jgi:transposase-like protein
MGAPTPLTREALTAVEQALLSFAKYEDAAAYAGVSRATFWRWRKAATEVAVQRDAGAHGPWAPDELLLLDLHDAVDRSSPAAKSRALMEIRYAGIGVPIKVTTTVTTKDKDGEEVTKVTVVERVERAWQAWAWLLERNFPDEFALVNRTEISGRGGVPMLTTPDHA